MKRTVVSRKSLIVLVGIASVAAVLVWSSAGYFARGSGSFGCPNQLTTVTLTGTNGFVNTIEHFKGETPDSGVHEFVLKPASIGSITLHHASPYVGVTAEERIQSLYDQTPAEYFGNMAPTIWNIDEQTGSIITDKPANVEDTGVSVNLKDVNVLGDGSVQVVYDIEAAQSAKPMTYALTVPQVCPGKILTIGESGYQGTLPWSGGLVN